MRSRATNVLQVIVLVTGIIYLAMGIMFYFFPLQVMIVFAENVSENWFELVRDHELVAPLYYITRAFAALVFASGLSMVMPLFDPLKYRGMIYFNGLIFPLLAAFLLIKNGFFVLLRGGQLISGKEEAIGTEVGYQSAHSIVVFLGVFFLVLFIINAVGLILTKRLANEGLE